MFLFHLKPEGITIVPKGINIVPRANYCSLFHVNARGITVPNGITIVANLLNVDPF
jgi:hypothetical protein